MIIIINGLPGTGKTTLCKKIANEFNFQYINDWEIFNKTSIQIDDFENKLLISKKYSNLVVEYIKNNLDKNIVLDLEYSISPKDYINNNLISFTKIIYFGFITLTESKLFKLFNKNISNNKEISYTKIKFYKEMSKVYYEDCLKMGLKFVDVNRDRNVINDEIILQIKNDMKYE